MSVGSNFVRPSHRRRAEGDGDRARQEPAGTSRAPSGNGSRIRPCAMWICPRDREFRMEASGTPSHRIGEDRSTTPAPNGAPGLPLARSSPGLRPRSARLTKCSTVRQQAKTSTTCVASRRSARDASSTELRSIYFSRRRLLATSPPREGQFFVLRHRHAIRGSTISRCASP
jgi:hypothetical protein